jgi:hypothetical protein
MLSFELKPNDRGQIPDELEVHLDKEGLDALLRELEFLKGKQNEHAHLMSESWGAYHLDNSPQDPQNSSIMHVKIFIRNGTNGLR